MVSQKTQRRRLPAQTEKDGNAFVFGALVGGALGALGFLALSKAGQSQRFSLAGVDLSGVDLSLPFKVSFTSNNPYEALRNAEAFASAARDVAFWVVESKFDHVTRSCEVYVDPTPRSAEERFLKALAR